MAIKYGPNDLIRDEHFLVTQSEVKQTSKGEAYYQLELANKEGKIEAKIWNNNIPHCNVEVGKVIELNGKTQEYKGVISIIIDSCQIVDSEETSGYKPMMKTMVFDIETAGKKFDDLDEVEQEYLLNNLEKNDEDKEVAKTKTGLYSIFGQVCAIGAFNPNSDKGMVLAISNKELKPEKENKLFYLFPDLLLLEKYGMKPKQLSKKISLVTRLQWLVLLAQNLGFLVEFSGGRIAV